MRERAFRATSRTCGVLAVSLVAPSARAETGTPVDPLGARATTTEATPAAEPVAPSFPRVRYALAVEPAFGVSGGSFYNQLVGARVDYRFTEQLSLGPYVGYANLKGHDGRAHNVLVDLQLEYRPELTSNGTFGVPLRFATGYLPDNGPVFRLSAGVAYALTRNVSIVVDPFAPTFWIIRNRTVISLGCGVEISYAP
ncbi:MAG TPA: hypothetical protein VJT73_11950 [Polyangiaceae bacterium]|nr:hypothetical protein [Polyangiaceae bacterium]